MTASIVKPLDNRKAICEVRINVGKSSKPSQAAIYRSMAKKPFGAWEKRNISIHHEMRPVLKTANESWREENYLNNRYSVQLSDLVTDWGPVLHLWVRRHDGTQPHSWADLQRIKNELAGKECLAVEVFPAVSRLIDEANLAHLWVLPEGFALPFTL